MSPVSVPNYLSTDATGKVSASFPGGLRMQSAPTAFNTDPEFNIQWVRDPSAAGGLVASIVGYTVGGTEGDIHIGSNDLLSTASAGIDIHADVGQSSIFAQAQTGGGLGTSWAWMLVDDNGNSDFVSGAPALPGTGGTTKMGAALINTVTPTVVSSTPCFVNGSVVKFSVGRIQFDVAPPLATWYGVGNVLVGGGAIVTQTQQIDTNTMELRCFNSITGAFSDATILVILFGYEQK